LIAYRSLEKTYHWFEKRLIENVKMTDALHSYYEKLAPWDTNLTEILISEKSILINNTLKDIELRHKFGINLVAIYRGTKNIFAPRGDEKIMPGDKLVILGNEEQIDLFKKNITTQKIAAEPEEQLQNFELTTLVLKTNNPFIGKTIRDSGVREHIQGLIVGLERKGVRTLNPDVGLILEEGDILFMVGSKESLDKFKDGF
jgi:CPA2 family monovalent cation:H+ antiporter-2